MAYTTQNWSDNVTMVDAEHLNHMEQGIADGQSHGDIFYGTCSTAYGTTTKAVTCEEFDELFAGAQILVQFSNYSIVASPSLNINQTGAKNIYVNGDVAASGNPFRWGAGAKIPFVYDGTGFIPVGYADGFAGACATSAATAAKTVSVDDFVLSKGATVTVQMTYANTNTSPTLNVSSTGAYSIAGNKDWKAGDYVTFTFNGTNYVAMGVNLDDLTAAVEKAQSTADEALSAVNSLQNNRYLWSGYLYRSSSTSQDAYVYTEPGFEVKDGATIMLYVPKAWRGYYGGVIYVNNSQDRYKVWTSLSSSGSASFSGFSAGGIAVIVYNEEYGCFEVRQQLSSIVAS